MGFLVVISSFGALSLPIPASADIYMVIGSSEGLQFNNGTDVCLDSAFVSANISRTSSTSVVVDFSSRFQIDSDLSQKVTLAFAYPSVWNPPNEEVSATSYTIDVNREPVSYLEYAWDDLNFTYSSNIANATGTWFEHAMFAVFDVSLDGQNSTEIDVSRQLKYGYLGNEFCFEYLVASARSFNGSTHQIVEITVDDEPDFLNVTFSPRGFLAEWTSGDTQCARWDFTVQETTIDRVSVSCTVSEYHGSRFDYNRNGIPDTYEILFLLASSPVIVTLAILLFVMRRRSSSRHWW